ncbi:cell division protein FtsA [Fontisphaera persica]|uniref:cell division protein FtsA n=1 Tax=Fontisphaera persica TaxID=2974023 RepID=UPI0024BF8B7D|nr:cell division protein FtsA [Fontisphaera persica]WCJ58006.1 cell division protein FtsA [Fontisphaera persica]
MFRSSSLLVGLEIGTAKVVAVVGEMSPAGTLSLIGIGQCASRGVRKGEIVDPVQAAEDVRVAIAEAEKNADVEIRSVYLGVTGGHLQGLTNRGVHQIVSVDRDITEEDVQQVIQNARAVVIPPANTIIHTMRQDFTVDGQSGIPNPVRMLGSRLEVDVHVVHGNDNRIKTAMRVVQGLQLQLDGVAFNGLASALAVLTHEDKEMGSLVIDLGAGVTEYVIYAGGLCKHTGVLAVGGDHISNDLAIGLKVPLGRAEELKIKYGSAVLRPEYAGQTVALETDHGLHMRTINLEHLNRIMALRVEEIFQLIEADLAQTGWLDHLRRGVFLVGGGARIPEIQQLAEQIFQLPVYLGRAGSINSIQSTQDQPEFATAIGLVKFGSIQQKRQPGLLDRFRDTLSGLMQRG